MASFLQRLTKIFSLGGLVFVLASNPALAQQKQAAAPNTLSRAFMLEILDFEPYCLQYHKQATSDPKRRNLRYFLTQETTSSAFLASNFILLPEYISNRKTPDLISNATLKAGYITGLAGSAVGVSSSSIELASNALAAIKNKKEHRSPKDYLARLMQHQKTLQNILDQRAETISSASFDDAKALQQEQEVLRLILARHIYECIDAYADAKSYQAGNNSFYAMDISLNACYLASYIVSLQGLSRAEKYGPSSAIGIAGNGISMASGPAYTYITNKLYDHYWKVLEKKIRTPTLDNEKPIYQAAAKLKSLLKGDENLRADFFSDWAQNVDTYEAKRLKYLRHVGKIALQSNIEGPLISGFSMASSIVNTVGGYRYVDNARRANNLAISGEICELVSNGATFVLNAQSYWHEAHCDKNLAKKGESPNQLLASRLSGIERLKEVILAQDNR